MKENNNIPEELNRKKLPQHVAIIMDGNGRWAKNQGKARIFGHEHAIRAVRETVEGCAELGIKYLTLYAFSTENWNRPKEEVDALMNLLVRTIAAETPTLQKNNIALQTIGDISSLHQETLEELETAKKATSKNSRMTLILALSYSSRWEIIEATKSIANDVVEGKIKTEEINDEIFSNALNTSLFPDPELMIRTSGEYRISNFLLWQLAYTELYFTPILWPDFGKEQLYLALIDFQNRERRFGKTGDQIKEISI